MSSKVKNFIHFAQPFFGKEEKKEILKTLDSGWVTLGPKTKEFEEDCAKYIGSKYAVAVSSCTAALHLSLLTTGIGSGDEVLTTIFTFAATANAIIYTNARPVFVDINPKTFNIDSDKIEAKITRKTKAIIPVHYGGQPANMAKILSLAKKYKLKVIEDAAHAIGTEYNGKKIGSIGDLTCFSFHPIKNISTGDGGMVATNHKKYAEKLILLRLHGMSKEAWKRHAKVGSWRYDILLPGYKYNMTDIQAALGIHQLKKLEGFICKREKYAQMYNKALADIHEIELPYVAGNIRHARNLYPIIINTDRLIISRDELIDILKEKNIGASVYFIPLHYMSYYKHKYGYKKGDFPIAERVFERIICLPIYPKMTPRQVEYIAETLINIISKYRK